MQVCNDPRYGHEKDTESEPYDHGVVEWTTDGYIAVLGQDSGGIHPC
jgi:hypothetical protein